MPAPARATDASGLAWQQHPGVQLDLGTPVRDEAGRSTRIGGVVGPAPVILDIGYFHCPSLCGVARSDLYGALQGSGLRPGQDYTLVSLSIDPAETPADAARARQADLAQAPFMHAADVHYLTAPAPSISAIAGQAGFHARYDPRFKQFVHPAGLVILTGQGVVSGYLLGVGYRAGDLRAAVLRASGGGIAEAALPVLLLCFHFDSTTGRYTLAIEKLLRLAAALTILTVGGLLLVLHRKRPRWSG